MDFDPQRYGAAADFLAAAAADPLFLLPFTFDGSGSPELAAMLRQQGMPDLPPGACSRDGALAGLWLLAGDFERAHSIAQDLPSAEGSYWHAILHRMEPDPGNSAYWFRRVGRHPVFAALRRKAAELPEAAELRLPDVWDPFWFIEVFEKGRRHPESAAGRFARQVHTLEWKLLFDHCALPEEDHSGF